MPWINEWSKVNTRWERVWSGSKREVEVLNFHEDFFAAPSYEGQHDSEILIRFRARPQAKMWKDWMAKFVEDFCAAHSGAHLLKVESNGDITG